MKPVNLLKSILRLLLSLAMVRFAWQSIVFYAFKFDQGYPLWPLLALAFSFWAYLRLAPPHTQPRPFHNSQSFDSILFLILALVGSACLLNLRHETPWTPLWFLHLVTLTFFQLLVPYIASRPFARHQVFANTWIALLLLALLWKGTGFNQNARLSPEASRFQMTRQMPENQRKSLKSPSLPPTASPRLIQLNHPGSIFQ